MYWEISQKNQTKKIGHFLGHFSTRYSKIWQKKYVSWRTAWKNENNVHLRFLIFENSSQRFFANILRDFQKSWNYENWPFSRPFFHQIQLAMTNKKYLMTISMDKLRKCTSQIFYFGNFVTEILAKCIERFSIIMKLWKLWKLAIF